MHAHRKAVFKGLRVDSLTSCSFRSLLERGLRLTVLRAMSPNDSSYRVLSSYQLHCRVPASTWRSRPQIRSSQVIRESVAASMNQMVSSRLSSRPQFASLSNQRARLPLMFSKHALGLSANPKLSAMLHEHSAPAFSLLVTASISSVTSLFKSCALALALFGTSYCCLLRNSPNDSVCRVLSRSSPGVLPDDARTL